MLQFMWRKDFLLHGAYLKKTLQILLYVFIWLYFIQCLTSFSLFDHLLFLYAWFLIFEDVQSNIDQVLSINPSINVFTFGEFNIHHKEWLIYFGRTDRPGQAFIQTLLSAAVFHQTCSFSTICLVQWLCGVAPWWTLKGKVLGI